MSWKNLASVAVIALLASPAWAQPTLHLTNVGLSGSGNWMWELSVEPEADDFAMSCSTCLPANTNGGSLAIELGLQTSLGDILGITTNPSSIPNAASGDPGRPIVEFENPGNVIFGWEALTELEHGDFPVGVQVGTGADSNQAFLALGTTFFESAGPHLIATIETTGPSTTTSLTTSLEVMGSYAGGSGAIAQGVETAPDVHSSVLYTGFAGTASRTAMIADANLDGSVGGLDLVILDENFNMPGTWGTGDFNGDGQVGGLDLVIMDENFNMSGGSNTPLTVQGVAAGAGAGGGATVPEPASLALAGLAMLAGLGLVRRKK